MTNQWDAELYEARHSFVWKYAASLIELLAPKQDEQIVDLGCGTGQLTADIASRGAKVLGVDSSPEMVAQARSNYPKLRFMLADATSFEVPETVDGVFSNAVLHWVIDAEAAVARISAALKPGGRFVAEFGGKGNTKEILAGVEAVVGSRSIPWYFPSIGEYTSILERNGLQTTSAQLFDRFTPLEGDHGLEDWLEMFGDGLLQSVPPTKRRETRAAIAEAVRPKLFVDGGWFADYKRLRVTAVKL